MSERMAARVARAIAQQFHGVRVTDEYLFGEATGGSAFLEAANAAIKAMRIPDRKMLDAASRAMSPGRRPTEKRVSVRAKHGIRYRAMIDAALTEKDKDDGR